MNNTIKRVFRDIKNEWKALAVGIPLCAALIISLQVRGYSFDGAVGTLSVLGCSIASVIVANWIVRLTGREKAGGEKGAAQ